jgi:hypothetical protein
MNHLAGFTGACVAALAMALGFAAHAAGNEQDGRIGTVSQPLVGGALVSVAAQEKYTLLTLTSPIGSCSASLLRNQWAITAAHCVDDAGATTPGQFMTVPDDSVELEADWSTKQTRKSMRVITFRPLDIAIIRVSQPFSVRGSTTNFIRDIFRDGQFPYFGQLSPVPIKIFGRGINRFARSVNGVPMQSSGDGKYRVGFVTTRSETDELVWYPSVDGQMIAGGDSGGPSFATVRGADEVLFGVHALCHSTCLAGQDCNASPWDWVTSTPECADAPIAPIWDDINRYLGAFVSGDASEPALEPPPPGFIGTFGTTPPNYQPMWVYAVKNDGDLMWYRKDSGTAAWQGPKKVGTGWADGYKDVIPAGGNSIYALTDAGILRWYRHDGFNDGSFVWKGGVDVGRGWIFKKIFSGGDGVVYAIRDDGTLLWYRHNGYADGGGINTWSGPEVVGSDWAGAKDVFSAGNGAIYVVRTDGTLSYYTHKGHATGEATWSTPRNVGTGWQNFRQIVSAGDGVILAINHDGKLLWYKHLGRSLLPQPKGTVVVDRNAELWEGPVEIGSGWHGFKKVFALLPATPQGPR